MKKSCIIIALLALTQLAFAQEEEEKTEKKKGFQKDRLFVGGDLTLAFGNRVTSLGASPYFGYSLNRYIDVAVAFNFTYTSQRDYVILGDKVRQTLYGPGTFVRVYPLKFLFAQAQFEHNFIRLKYIPADNSGYLPSSDNLNVSSFLVGAGYAGGRTPGNSSFYYFSVSWDVLKDKDSPYVDGLGRAIPIIRAGYNIALFQGRRGGF